MNNNNKKIFLINIKYFEILSFNLKFKLFKVYNHIKL